MAPPAKRRIQPQLISQPQGTAAAAKPVFAASQIQSNGFQQTSVPPMRVGTQRQLFPEPKEDSEIAAKLGMKGRRVYVTLTSEGQEINFRKVTTSINLISLLNRDSHLNWRFAHLMQFIGSNRILRISSYG